jgi:hypothetical protein
MIQKIITLSTEHIKQETGEFLNEESSFQKEPSITVYKKDEFGWFVYITVPKLAEDNHKIPEDLDKCIQYAIKHECMVLCFDCDEPPVYGLPIYKW